MASSNESIGVNCTTEFAAYPLVGQTGWGVCTLKAPFYEPESRAPVDIVAVIDKSGSMHGEKLDLVKETLEFVIDQLKDTDRLSVVTYDTNVKVDFGLTTMNQENKERSKVTVKAIRDGSSTNLCGGLLKGMEQIIGRTGTKAQVASVLLLTDGLANVGISNREGIMEEMRKVLDPKPGNTPFDGTIYTFGFGSDHDARLLESVSTQGGGVYYYIDSAEKIPESFADCLGGLLSVMGQNLTLKLEAGENTSILNVHTNKPTTWKTKGKCCEITMGDLQSEEERDILLELQLPAVADMSQQGIIGKLSYFNVINSKPDEVNFTMTFERNNGPRGEASKKLDSQRNRIIATTALKEARSLADQGNYSEAKKVLEAATKKISESVSVGEQFCQGLLSDLTNAADTMRSQHEYKSKGAHYLMSKMQTHSAQRSNYLSEETPYSNTSRGIFVAKSKAMKKK
ncbi:PREDICTED: uncharacterized protein LOC100635885 [Amphimedon queenslandica]|uniref:VWFA domain-containing protein n=1 Tax=Amphimedon queenslandica TaxID=400682 RepID=A0A1X7VRQ2_AMPQE|nr:PREDICTED: uncharacterized protein LOC100635885 [Amphimedon queenslandica]|eukprot:XP_003383100.1 PREDICTED: uncharacterized protein LOC100635885 [Amphimedon queenslandica]